MHDHSGRIALITGATRGIGYETARQLAGKGVIVLLTGRDEQRTNAAAQRLVDEGLECTPIVLDVTDRSSISAAVKETARLHDRIDILINNAGIRIEEYGKRPSDQPLEKWHRTFATNLFGTVAVTQAFLPLIEKSPAGRIVNVSSLLASLTRHSDQGSYAYSEKFKSLPAYSASKSAINSWTVHLAFELRDTRIKVNAVHPGYTKTDMNEGDGELEVDVGAETAVRMALLDDDGPSGSYVHLEETLPW